MTDQEQKAIEILDTFELRRKTKNYNKLDLNDVYASQIALNLISKQQADIEIKDKVIDLMAEDRAEIGEPKVSKQAIIDFYYKKVEEEKC